MRLAKCGRKGPNSGGQCAAMLLCVSSSRGVVIDQYKALVRLQEGRVKELWDKSATVPLLPSILFANILHVCSLNVRVQILSSVYKFTVLYVLILSPHHFIRIHYCPRSVQQPLLCKLSYPQPEFEVSSLTQHVAGLRVKAISYQNLKICLVYFIQASNTEKKCKEQQTCTPTVEAHFEVSKTC